MNGTAHPVKQRVLASVPKSLDVETHVRLVEIDGHTSVALSDYIVSLGEYGRSYWMDPNESNLKMIAQALSQITSGTKV
jgi:hypothetical protein